MLKKKDFKCLHCVPAFSKEFKLKKHFEKYHNAKIANNHKITEKNTENKCKICYKLFKTKNQI